MENKLNPNWGGIHFAAPIFEKTNDTYNVKCTVWLGAIEPEDVKVQIYRILNGKSFAADMKISKIIKGAINGFVYESDVPALISERDYAIRVIPSHPDAAAPLEFNRILWQK